MNGKNSLGFVETASFVAAIEAADAMVKAAYVTLSGSHKIGAGRVCTTVQGDLASCLAAVAAGRAAAERLGAFLQATVIARPDQDTGSLWTIHMPEAGQRKAARRKQKAGPLTERTPPMQAVPLSSFAEQKKKRSSAKSGGSSGTGKKQEG